MKKFFASKWIALVMALTLVLGLTTLRGHAAQSCTVTFSDPTVTVGQTFTVNVKVTGAVAIATVKVNFDPTYLQFVSGDLGYGRCEGTTVIMDKENMGSGNLSFSMTFKALKTGKTTINNYENFIVDSNEELMNVTPGWSSVTINAKPTASGNNNLSALSISPGTLSPGFSAGTTSYRASVSNSTTSVAVSARAADSKAKVAVWGNTGLRVGDNTVTVQVTAENGSKKTYTITVNRASGGGNTGGNTGGGNSPAPEVTQTPEPTPTPMPEIMVTLPDDTRLPVSTQLPEGETLPKGFESSQLEVEGQTLPTAVHKEGGLVAVYLAGDEEHPAGFYFYNEKTRQVQAMTPVPMSTGKLTLLDLPQELVIPEGYTSTLMELGGQQHTLLVPDQVEEPNHYIVYALDQEGKLGLYLYDVEQKSFQRYQFTQLGEEALALAEEQPQDEGFVFTLFGREIRTGWSDSAVSYLLVGLSALCVVLLAAVIVLVVCLVKARKALLVNEVGQGADPLTAQSEEATEAEAGPEESAEATQAPAEEPEQPCEDQEDNET